MCNPVALSAVPSSAAAHVTTEAAVSRAPVAAFKLASMASAIHCMRCSTYTDLMYDPSSGVYLQMYKGLKPFSAPCRRASPSALETAATSSFRDCSALVPQRASIPLREDSCNAIVSSQHCASFKQSCKPSYSFKAAQVFGTAPASPGPLYQRCSIQSIDIG